MSALNGARPRRGQPARKGRPAPGRAPARAARGRRLLERVVERRLVKRCAEAGALARKLLGRAGDPDRLVLAPGGRACLVEAKRPGEKARKLQRIRHRELRALGHEVYVLDTLEKVEAWAARWLCGPCMGPTEAVEGCCQRRSGHEGVCAP